MNTIEHNNSSFWREFQGSIVPTVYKNNAQVYNFLLPGYSCSSQDTDPFKEIEGAKRQVLHVAAPVLDAGMDSAIAHYYERMLHVNYPWLKPEACKSLID